PISLLFPYTTLFRSSRSNSPSSDRWNGRYSTRASNYGNRTRSGGGATGQGDDPRHRRSARGRHEGRRSHTEDYRGGAVTGRSDDPHGNFRLRGSHGGPAWTRDHADAHPLET